MGGSRRPLGSAVLLASALALIGPVPAAGQAGWEVTPHLGFYVPTGSVVDVEGSEGTESLRMRHQSAGLVGVTVGWTGGHLALEGRLAYSPSAVAVRDASTTTDVTAGVFLGVARAMLRLRTSADPGEWNAQAGAGFGAIGRAGAAWSGFEGTTDLALVLAAEGHYPFGVSTPLEFRLGIEDYVTTAGFRRTDLGTVGEGVHHDLVITLGISLGTGGSEP